MRSRSILCAVVTTAALAVLAGPPVSGAEGSQGNRSAAGTEASVASTASERRSASRRRSARRRRAVRIRRARAHRRREARRQSTERAGCPEADTEPGADLDGARQATLCLLNDERSRRGIRQVATDAGLALAADRHARDMVARAYFAHDSPGGLSFVARILRSGYARAGSPGWVLGENLAWGSGELATPRSIVTSWMRSPGHRANVLNDTFRDIGVAVAPGAPQSGVSGPAATYATEYGRR